MKFESVWIRNFKGIEDFNIEGLEDMVVIAGPNGCGKSSILDAIRLLKSAYGGYNPNEWQQWFGEFQINMNETQEAARLLRRRTQTLRVEAVLSLAEREREYITENLDELAWALVWRQLVPNASSAFPMRGQALASDLRAHGAEVEEQSKEFAAEVLVALSLPIALALTIEPNGSIDVESNPLAELCFQTYKPDKLGVVDFYSAQRQYAREQIGGITLNLEQIEANRSQHLLYNSQQKLQNVKAELAASYITDLIARDSGAAASPKSLQRTLQELFDLFFEGKRFDGVRPTSSGRPSFPVTLQDGSTHDIDDLSSGEKEILYGYLRLRNSRAESSIILLDEPELHLNPRLVRGLPVFYQTHISRAFGNQLWLITHSDAMLRESVGNVGFSVFHMQAAVGDTGENQARVLSASTEIDQAIVDIVGDLAAYRPGAPIVVLEGNGERSFDVTMVARLFPEMAERVNLIAGGQKARVRDLYRLLTTSSQAGAVLGGKVVAIVDGDSELVAMHGDGVFAWPVYHIENYLLWAEGIQSALQAALGYSPFNSIDQVEEALLSAARASMPELVAHQLSTYVNESIVSKIDLRFSPAESDPSIALSAALDRSVKRLNETAMNLTPEHLSERADAETKRLGDALAGGDWRVFFRGRSVLKRFVGQLNGTLSYEVLRNLIVDQMVRSQHRPATMEAVLRAALPSGVFVKRDPPA